MYDILFELYPCVECGAINTNCGPLCKACEEKEHYKKVAIYMVGEIKNLLEKW